MTPFAPLPLSQLPPWLAQLHQVIRVYPVDPETGCGAALCRWCDLTWPLPVARLEADPVALAAFLVGVAEHGLEHASNGELRLDTHGLPLDDDLDPKELGWLN
jgi:hypothetical protein